MSRRVLLRRALLGVAAGVAATAAKGKAEAILQPLGERAFPPAAAAQIGLGADASGHPENMPPSELVDRVQHAVTGDELSDAQRQRLSPPLHWATGVGFGVFYALVSAAWPSVRAGYGTVAGAALFATTHGSALPLAGLQQPPSRMPRAWWVWEAGSHLFYGLTLDIALRGTEQLVRRTR